MSDGSRPDEKAAEVARQLMLVERERHVLSEIARGVPLPRVLEDLLLAVEAAGDGSMCTSILLLNDDGRTLNHGAGPSLPAAYSEAIDGISIGEGVGSCGTSAQRGAAVYATDIDTDPLWADFRDLALSHNLRACWSTPIKGAGDETLGTFAIYHGAPRAPTPGEMATIASITQTVSLAIERHRSDRELRQGEERLREAAVTLEGIVAERTRELHAARTSLEIALNAADMGGWDIDLATGEARRTLRHDRIFGYEQLIPEWNIDTFLSHVPLSHRDPVAAAFEEASMSGELQIDCPIKTVDGKERWITARGRMAYDDNGNAVRMSGVVFDITAFKETEAQLLQAQKMEAIGQLTGGVAHDFNNLLTVIRGSVDLLRRDSITPDKRARYIDAIGDTADRAAKLTAQLLAFARRQALAPETFDCGQSIRDVSTIVQTLVGSRINLVTTVPDDPCLVVADRGQFDTAIINMSINGRDAMTGEGNLTISVGPVSGIPSIRAHAPVVGSFVAVTIRDTGNGIDPDRAARIFEPFYTTKGPGHGTGLGLSQVFGFAKQSNGDVLVDSVVGEGTTFTLYLPRAASDDLEQEDRQTNSALIGQNGHGARVLVVEDNEQVGIFAVDALRQLGYQTVLAVNAAEALAKLRSDRDNFDIVFSDVVMPGMDGLEMGQEIRRLYSNLPVILTSGYSHVLAQNGKHGFELLHKPYSVEHLSRILQKSFRWRKH